MVNTINEFQERNKQLLEENENLKRQLADKEQETQFKQLNNDEIREWIATMLSKRHYTDNPDVDVVNEIMRAAHCNQEEWEWFCKVYPTEAARGNVILAAYQYFPYWKQSSIHWQVRNKAKRDIFINLIKLNSEESKELFRKWVREGKIENNLTLKGILEKGYEGWDSIKQSCYDYYELRNLSLDELISSWNELTVNANKKAAKVNELEEKVEALKVELEKSDDRIEELEERVDIEVEMNLKALDKSAEWREKQLKEVKSAHVLREKWFLKQIEVLENNIDWLKNKEQVIKKYEDRELPALPKKQKQNRLLKFKKLVNKVKEKSKEKFQTHVLEKFEAHILQPN